MWKKKKSSYGSYKSSTYARIPGYNKSYKKKRSDARKIWAWVGLTIFGILALVGGLWFYLKIIKNLPEISEIENFNFKQATTITDKNGIVLYKLFEENRDYIGYEKISENFINGLVATEDQRFWENPGVDWKGTIRAGLTDILEGKTHGGSTLTQQIIKNILLSPEKKIERKLKEIILAMKLSNYIKDDIRHKYNNLSKDELDVKAKEKILEIYANLVFYGNNSYGIETASRTYFDKSAAELSVLEGSILAGLPQSPSRYNPYSNRPIVMGSLQITDTTGTPAEVSDSLKSEIFSKIEKSINESNFTFKRDDSAVLDFFKGLLSFKITHQGQTYQVNYKTGRKDTVLSRMYEEGYITEAEFKKAFFEGFMYEFSRGKVEIKAPHFVFWVKELLEENYDPEILRKEGLTIKTSLDYNIQEMAEAAIEENEEHLLSYSAGNSAMIYVDSQDGDVIAYVGSKDYNNDDIDGQVDVIQSPRQPGSSIKPFVYALGFMKLALTIDSPIYDIRMTIANNTPANADGGFTGLTSIKRALAGSRNIPAIKMFLAAGGETPFKNFLYSLGVRSLTMNQELYGYPLSIGAGEMTMFELAQAYTHLSAMGKPAKINPILEIRGSDGSILYKKQVQVQEQTIPAGVAYLIWSILSDKSNFPSGWINTLSYPNISFATKSGTTNVVRGTEKLPRDGWLANYTPDKVIINWSGNTDGSALRKDAFGGWLNSPIRKSFVKRLDESGNIQSVTPAQADVKSVAISKITGKLASAETPLAFTQKSLGYVNTLPTQVDNNVQTIQVDTMCGKLPTELTPTDDIVDAYIVNPQSILPDKRDQGAITARWKEVGAGLFEEQLGQKILLEQVEGTCEERNIIAELGQIAIVIMQPTPGQAVTREFTLWHQSKSPFKITNLKLYLGTIELKSFTYNQSGTLTTTTTVKIPDEIPAGTYPLKAVIFDEKGYSDSKSVQIKLIDDDTNAPYLLEDKVKITEKNGAYQVALLFADDESTIAGGSVTRGEDTLFTITGEVAIFTIESLEDITYTVQDAAGNEKTGTISLATTN